MSDERQRSPRKRQSVVDERQTRRSKRSFSSLNENDKRAEIEAGKRRFRNSIFHGSDLRLIRADNCTIYGDNNFVQGDYNLIVGSNNQASGVDNRFSIPAPPPPPPPPPPPQPAPVPVRAAVRIEQERRRQAPTPVRTELDEAMQFLELLARYDRSVSNNYELASEGSPGNAGAAAAAPPPAAVDGADVVSALDLEGDAVPADEDEQRCAVCMENRIDTLFRPCRHICCCRECARQMAHEKLKTQNSSTFACPKCRQPVTAMTIVFI